MRRGFRTTCRWGGWVLLLLMLLTPMMPWREARLKYGLAPWEPVDNSGQTWRFENRVDARGAPTSKLELGFEQGRLKLGFADIPPTSAPNEIGRDYGVLVMASRSLFTYHVRRHA